MHKTALDEALNELEFDGREQALAAVGDEEGLGDPSVLQIAEEGLPRVSRLRGAGREAEEDPRAVGRDAPRGEDRLGLRLVVDLEVASVEVAKSIFTFESRRFQVSNSARRRWQMRLASGRLIVASLPKVSASIASMSGSESPRTQHEMTSVLSAFVLVTPTP